LNRDILTDPYELFAGFQEDLEKGKSTHLFPAFFAKERVKKGEIKEEDIPVSHLFH